MHSKRLLVILTCLAFVAVTALSLGALYTVAEVDTVCSVFSEDGQAAASEASRLFDGYRGKNLTFFKTSRVYADAKKYPYLKIEDVKKDYPNKIVVSLSERREVYAVPVGETYAVCDGEGVVLSQKSVNENNADGLPNVIVGLSVASSEAGEVISFSDGERARAVRAVTAAFSDIRNEVSEISFGEGVVPYLFIRMRTGVTVALDFESSDIGEKLSLALAEYDSQPEYRKLSGFIVESGQQGFMWTPRKPL